jgi:hypothetical protein
MALAMSPRRIEIEQMVPDGSCMRIASLQSFETGPGPQHSEHS